MALCVEVGWYSMRGLLACTPARGQLWWGGVCVCVSMVLHAWPACLPACTRTYVVGEGVGGFCVGSRLWRRYFDWLWAPQLGAGVWIHLGTREEKQQQKTHIHVLQRVMVVHPSLPRLNMMMMMMMMMMITMMMMMNGE